MTYAHATGGWGWCPARALRASARSTGRQQGGQDAGQMVRPCPALPCPAVRCPTSFAERMRTLRVLAFPRFRARKPLLVLSRPGILRAEHFVGQVTGGL